jgi:SnoaL-like domain
MGVQPVSSLWAPMTEDLTRSPARTGGHWLGEPRHNRQVLERFDAVLGAADISELDELCAPDMVNHLLAPDRPAGLAGTREFLETQGRHQMTGQYWDELVVVADGDYIV